MPKPILAGLIALSLILGACGKNPEAPALALLKSGDRAGALQALEGVRAKHPDSQPARMLLFVLYQYQASQGEPARHDAFLQSAIGEFAWLAQSYGFSPDYKDMEGSLKSHAAARAAYEAAYAAVYAR